MCAGVDAVGEQSYWGGGHGAKAAPPPRTGLPRLPGQWGGGPRRCAPPTSDRGRSQRSSRWRAAMPGLAGLATAPAGRPAPPSHTAACASASRRGCQRRAPQDPLPRPDRHHNCPGVVAVMVHITHHIYYPRTHAHHPHPRCVMSTMTSAPAVRASSMQAGRVSL